MFSVPEQLKGQNMVTIEYHCDMSRNSPCLTAVLNRNGDAPKRHKGGNWRSPNVNTRDKRGKNRCVSRAQTVTGAASSPKRFSCAAFPSDSGPYCDTDLILDMFGLCETYTFSSKVITFLPDKLEVNEYKLFNILRLLDN